MARTKKQTEPAMPRIYTVRRQKVVLDADLAKLYGVEVRHLNQAVRRNAKKFPPEFCFLIHHDEEANLKSQIAISNADSQERLRSQNVILKKGRGGHRKHRSLAFTEHGALMAPRFFAATRQCR